MWSSSPTTTLMARHRDGCALGGPVAAHGGVRRRGAGGGAASAPGRGAVAGGLGLLRRDVRGPDRHDVVVRARRRGMAAGGRVRIRRDVAGIVPSARLWAH